jgi:hypothetical protein
MIFASDNDYFSLQLPSNGQGNTYLPGANDLTPPTNPTSLISNDHTVNVWSNDNTVNVAWSGANDTGGSGLDGYSIAWDTSPSTVPDPNREVDANTTNLTSPMLADGSSWYFHLRAVDGNGNPATNAVHLGPFKIDTTLPKSVSQSPLFAIGSVPVSWSGADTGSGLANYTVWARDGAGGTWTRWLSATTMVSATFTSGTAGHTYDFRSVAIDRAGNVETDVPADGDTHTTVAAFAVTGRVFNNQHQLVFNVNASTDPAALNVAKSNDTGQYMLYFATPGTYSLTVSRSDFGALPQLTNLVFGANTTAPDLVLPPLQEAMTNGNWEIGDLSGWTVDPAITPAVEITAAHTGNFGLRLTTGSGPRKPQATAGFTPALTQTTSLGATQPVLSLMYRVTQGSDNPFIITLAGDTEVITHELNVTPTEWTHVWVDLTPFAGQVITLTLGFQNPAVAQQIDLDEISIGGTQVGVYTTFLSVIRR